MLAALDTGVLRQHCCTAIVQYLLLLSCGTIPFNRSSGRSGFELSAPKHSNSSSGSPVGAWSAVRDHVEAHFLSDLHFIIIIIIIIIIITFES